MYWSLQLLGGSFQKARNFTASSHQNAGFSNGVFKKFLRVIPRDPHSGWGGSPTAPNSQLGLWPGAGHKRAGVGTQTLVPSTFQPWLRPWAKAYSIVTNRTIWQPYLACAQMKCHVMSRKLTVIKLRYIMLALCECSQQQTMNHLVDMCQYQSRRRRWVVHR